MPLFRISARVSPCSFLRIPEKDAFLRFSCVSTVQLPSAIFFSLFADLKHQAMEFFSSYASRVMESPAWEQVASAHPALVNDALRVMAKRHGGDLGSESPKKKLKFSPCFGPPWNSLLRYWYEQMKFSYCFNLTYCAHAVSSYHITCLHLYATHWHCVASIYNHTTNRVVSHIFHIYSGPSLRPFKLVL